MKVVLATGIYPPDIGGPATYVKALASELSRLGNDVRVVTYGADSGQRTADPSTPLEAGSGSWKVVVVSRSGGPLLRWWRYAKVLRQVAHDADSVEAFSSVSVGIPLMLSGLGRSRTTRAKRSGVGAPPRTLLRLGGDFFWERYTDRGGMKGLKDWYASRLWSKWLTQKILRSFDHIVFSTRFQEELYEAEFTLPAHSVIENALPAGSPVLHSKHAPLKLLFMGRFVGFKNLPSLVAALTHLPEATLTFVGQGPEAPQLRSRVADLHIQDRVTFLPPVSGTDKQRIFADYDLLVLPSLTELSPNVALEARMAGLPVLLSAETGLSASLTQGMGVRPLRTSVEIEAAIREVMNGYEEIAREAALPPPKRGWEDIARAHLALFASL